MREVRLLVECGKCRAFEVAIRPTESEAEKAIEQRGWKVAGEQVCPKCRKGSKK